MHDFTLWRTTNVKKVFPKRAKDRASTFTIAEIKQLDAGSHFSSKYKGTQVPTFEELLAFVTSKNLSLIFDLGPPTKDHPFFHSYVNVTVNIIKKMNAIHQVIWLIPDRLDDGSDGISFQEELMLLPQVHGIRIAVGVTSYSKYNLSPEQAKHANVSIVNALSAMGNGALQSYLQAGLHLNTYTVNDRWLFSQMWCLGSNTVTTETFRDLTKMTRSHFANC
jgi:glycerophosphoryl diester phosphodiesterase